MENSSRSIGKTTTATFFVELVNFSCGRQNALGMNGKQMPRTHGRSHALRVGEYNYKSSAVAEMGDRLATKGMGRKWGGAAVGAGSPLGPI